MKKVIVFVIVVLSFSSCKKEFSCSNGATYKYGSKEYAEIKQTGTITDYNGQEYHCY